MPIYEFKCLKCGEFFEVITFSKKEDEETKCPKCSSYSFERVISKTNYSLGSKGSPSTNVQKRECSNGTCSTCTVPGVE